jgi:hypothetical protein
MTTIDTRREQPGATIVTRILLVSLCLLSLQAAADTALWSSSSKDFGESASDFTLREVERRPMSSILQVDIKHVGASVGSSMTIACMLARLAEARGSYRYLIKLERLPSNPNQMLVGFSHKPNVNPQSIDPELPASATVMDLEIFGPGFNKVCRAKKR